MLALDIESLNIKSSSVVLSVGMTYIKDDKPQSYESLLNSSIFVKLDTRSQIAMGRTVGKSTVEWWSRQADIVKQKSMIPSSKDVHPKEAIEMLRKWLSPYNMKNELIWTRGGMDQLVMEDLADMCDIPDLAPFNRFRDIRTALEIIYPSAKNGYVEVDPDKCLGFTIDKVLKHSPEHDCAYDMAMLLFGKQE